MGSGCSCCRRESPCGSAEETSGLLKDESKTVVPTRDTHAVGSCAMEGDDDMRKMPNEADIKEEVEVKQIPEFTAKDANNTQEIKPLHREVLQTAPSPRKKSKLEENSTRAQDEGDLKDRPAETGQDQPLLLQRTLSLSRKDSATAHWEVFTATKEAEKPTSVQENFHESPENHTETNTTGKHIISGLGHNEDEVSKVRVNNVAAVVEPLLEFSDNNKVLLVPNTELSTSAHIESTLNESPRRAVTEDSKVSLVCHHEAPDVCESSPGPEPMGLNHRAEEDRDAASTLREPETTDPADASESPKSDQDAGPDLECASASPEAVTSSEIIKQETGEEVMREVQQEKVGEKDEKEDEETKEEEEIYRTQEEIQTEKDAETKEEKEGGGNQEQKEKITCTEGIPAVEKEESEDGLGNSDEDLYRGEEELSASQTSKQGSLSQLETTVENRCSLAPAVDILHYSEQEWKGNTAKSALIRKGYKEMSQRFGSVRRVRGDNYCALRATLFQVLSHSTLLPSWLQDDNITMLPKQLEAQEGLISQWTFPAACLEGDGAGDVTQQLKGYMELLKNKWQAAVDCPSTVERQQLCERLFQGGEEELGLLEALKLLMLGRAIELHSRMQGGADVPLFCWLLFARDSSDCPRSFLHNHLRHVGLSAGLEQVEMFLLGYALQCTIQVYRLYKADTEEFVTFYPDDHKDEWPCVCLVTEDDRHYNVPIVVATVEEEAAAENSELNNSS